MSSEQSIEQRMDILENKVTEILTFFSAKDNAEIDKDKFAKFYNTTKYDIPIKVGLTPLCIWINKRYEEDMKTKMLYPSDIEGYWYVTGEVSPIPIGFKETINNEDYYADFRVAGNFI